MSSDYQKWEREKEKKKKERIEGLRKESEKEKKEEERALQEEIDSAIKDWPKRLREFYGAEGDLIARRYPIPEGSIRSNIIEQRKTKKPWLYNNLHGEPKIKDYYDIPVGEPRITIGEPPNMYDHPPVIRCTITGFVFATVSFFVVLYGLRGMTRGTRWFILWIIEGFRDKKAKEPDERRKQ